MTEKKHIGLGTFKNVFLLGLAGLGAWWAWDHIVEPTLKSVGKGGSGQQYQPALNGPVVTAGKIAIVASNKCITQKDDQFIYTPIFATFDKVMRVIKSPVNGRFTGRMLCSGPIKYAEIYKTS